MIDRCRDAVAETPDPTGVWAGRVYPEHLHPSPDTGDERAPRAPATEESVEAAFGELLAALRAQTRLHRSA